LTSAAQAKNYAGGLNAGLKARTTQPTPILELPRRKMERQLPLAKKLLLL